MSDNESDMTPAPLEETCHIAVASGQGLCFQLVWDSDKIELYNDKEGKQRWRCHHCGENWAGKNHTKALRHVSRTLKGDMKPCSGKIPPHYKDAYMALLRSKEEDKSARKEREEVLDIGLTTTDSRTLSIYQDQKSHRKRPPKELQDLTLASPLTVSTASGSTFLSTVSRKVPKHASLQTTLNGVRGTTSAEARHKANVAIAHWILANDNAHNSAEDPLFARVVRHVQQCGTDFKPPSRYEIGGDLLDATYSSYYDEEKGRLMQESKIFGASLYGDGATIKGTPMINVLASTPSNPSFVIDVIDCTEHMQAGGKKDAKYIALEMLALMHRVDPGKTIFNQILFDGASNVQKAGLIMEQHFPRAVVNHGAEHVVALVVDKLVSLPCFREYSKFSKVVRSYVAVLLFLCFLFPCGS